MAAPGKESGGENGGGLAHNVIEFGRLLRRAGLPVGPAEMLAAAEALTRIDIGNKEEVRAALAATLIHRREHRDLFDYAFGLFWRDAAGTRFAQAMAMLEARKPLEPPRPDPLSRRLTEAFAPPRASPPPAPEPEQRIDAVLTASTDERLRQMDFEAMSADEIAAAKRAISRLVLPLDALPTRRRRLDPRGERIDLRATLRLARHSGGEILAIARLRRRTRPPPLVVICDISGSMARYAQILLHFIHAVTARRGRVTSFLFGTRLTNVTRYLRYRDPEVAFQMVARAVPDWSGGTRIGEALAEFNRRWARRVLAQGAIVLLMTDGLDRDAARGLAENMERLHRSCRRLIWLNPLLRWEGFQPKSQGVRAMLPHVDEFRPVHNLASLEELVAALERPPPPREEWYALLPRRRAPHEAGEGGGREKGQGGPQAEESDGGRIRR
jgi:uncharacterized protein with von Willebrand factor type A (vWA) domain